MIQINPNKTSKIELFELGKQVINMFSEINNLKNQLPEIEVDNYLNNYGQYLALHIRSEQVPRIKINLNKCPMPVAIRPIRRWSFTGYKADRTPTGVLCHEFGHHYFFKETNSKKACVAMLKIIKQESPITSYEPNYGESFAEMFRLFMLNPNLLELGRPKRYEYITKELKLLPIHNQKWEDVLKYAHPRIIEVAKKWINK